MDDRTMLELAAKAAGIDLEFRVLRWTDGSEYPCYVDRDSVSTLANTEIVVRWNPLTDDGDALRLAVKLELSVDTNWYNCDACWFTEKTIVSSFDSVEEEPHNDDPYAATRRAITRAAAAIQLAKESGK